jgi:hypothetical protein
MSREVPIAFLMSSAEEIPKKYVRVVERSTRPFSAAVETNPKKAKKTKVGRVTVKSTNESPAIIKIIEKHSTTKVVSCPRLTVIAAFTAVIATPDTCCGLLFLNAPGSELRILLIKAVDTSASLIDRNPITFRTSSALSIVLLNRKITAIPANMKVTDFRF